ncbi:FimV/HubP family polar landmark protein [Cupriavidus pauculus]|uniref:Pilus assembly protein FimV n=1 Tax=Cupriavidus pauculus TaxID=82633 RepID=A0A2N5CA67_9BURK|nr:FimV/HubP family polar landmark protein [Cupriavidus pauculus]PLP99064.1 pilus assembly protein FimV [Cupriavidus pauculus]
MSVSLHRRKDAPTVRQRWSTLAITAAGLLLAQPAAYAAGFGQLRVQSNLGQPLQAEIDITGVTPEEADSLAVKLAAPGAYSRAGLTYLSAIASVKLDVQKRPNGTYVATVRSNQPLSEPFVDILVDMSWSSGKITRAYTFLLDPAGAKPSSQAFSPTTVVQAATPDASPAAAPAPAPVAAAPAAVAPAPAAAPAPARQPRRAAAPAAVADGAAANGGYTVQQGDTLYSIAGDATQGVDSVSLEQMLLALYRNNPNAFIGGNINRIKSGAVLKVPSAQQAQSVSPREARREVVARTQGFDSYRSRLAAAAAAKSVEAGSGREQSGNVTARVQDTTVPNAGPRDELKLSKAEKGAQAKAEAEVASQRKLKDAESRVADLEKNISDMQRLMELKNSEIAKLNQNSQSAKAATAAAATAAATAAPAAGKAADTAAAPAPTVVPAEPAKAADATSTATPEPAPAAAAAAASAPDATATAATAAASAPQASASAPAAASTPVAAAKKKPVVQPVPEPSFLDELLANPMLLPGAGVLVALLGGYAYYRRRQKQKASENTGFGDSILSQESTVMAGGHSLFGTAGGQSVDTSQHSVFGADFRIGNNSPEATEVDPIAEAEVYIAYGRDVQAEEILREALQQNPERQAIRLKLLEIYNTRQDVEGFRVIAEEMFAQVGGQGADWQQVAEMGRKLDPSNALYLSVAPDTTAEADTTTPVADQWRTQDPAQSMQQAPQASAMPDLALPLDAFPAPAPGEPIVAPASASLVFGNEIQAEPVARLDDVLDERHDAGLDLPADGADRHLAGVPALDTPTRSRPLEFDMSSLSLDLNAVNPGAAVAAEPASVATFEAPSLTESTVPLPAPTMLQNGRLVEPIDLSRVTSEGNGDSTHGVSASTLSATGMDGSRDMQIKLDLARAYIEIGDKEGARELLQEVVEQSEDPLQTEARTLLRDVA